MKNAPIVISFGVLSGNVGIDFPTGQVVTLRQESPPIFPCGIHFVDEKTRVIYRLDGKNYIEGDTAWMIVYAVARYAEQYDGPVTIQKQIY